MAERRIGASPKVAVVGGVKVMVCVAFATVYVTAAVCTVLPGPVGPIALALTVMVYVPGVLGGVQVALRIMLKPSTVELSILEAMRVGCSGITVAPWVATNSYSNPLPTG